MALLRAVCTAEWVKELLPLLEDEPFRVVNRMGLAGSTDVKAVKDCLEQRYAPKGTELEWQLKLQTRVQQRDEPLSDFAGHLKLLASKAYPDWEHAPLQELTRNLFIQGLNSPRIQLQLMRDMPSSLDSALKDARKLESIEVAQQHLQAGRNPAKSLLLELGSQDIEMSSQANATASGTRDLMELKVSELTAQVQKLTEELARLRASSSPLTPGSENRQGSEVVCWGCRQTGHN